MAQQRKPTQSRLRVLRTGDPQSAFHFATAEEILAVYGRPKTLLSTSAKAQKCGKVGVLNRVLYLPSGIFCPAATEGCLTSCLGHSSGRMQMPSSARARDRRAALYLADQEHFLSLLRADLHRVRCEAFDRALIPAVRLNGTSDLPWERLHPELFEEFPDLCFFDYTKLRPRVLKSLWPRPAEGKWPLNYHLTFSLSEKNEVAALGVLQRGGNVAVVFESDLPKKHLGYRVIDGDRHDARFLDPDGVIVGLRAKGVAKNDQTGFVQRTTAVRRAA